MYVTPVILGFLFLNNDYDTENPKELRDTSIQQITHLYHDISTLFEFLLYILMIHRYQFENVCKIEFPN